MRLRTLSLTAFGLLWLAASTLLHGADAVVTVTNFVFTAGTVTINEGELVTWNNTLGFHNVKSDTLLFTSGSPASAPWTYSHTFPTAGTYPYYCEVHGGVGGVGMSGVVKVLPSITIANRAVVEGPPAGIVVTADLTVTLSAPSADPVTVMFNTIDDTAIAGSDYAAVAGTMLTFPPGTTSQVASVSIIGDAASEDNETFFVHLSSPTGATIALNQATGTILDDDAADFFALPPCRVVDTRQPPGTWGGPALAANSTRTFPFRGRCGIPLDARAVALNVTTVNEGALGDLRLYPADAVLPDASTINFSAGKVRANNAMVILGGNGYVAVRNDMPMASTATTDVVIDVSGYFKAIPGP